MANGNVPMFKMRPQMGPIWIAIAILVVGVAAYFNGQQQVGDPDAQQLGRLALAICVVVSGGFVIVATGRMWFRHLWHDRYHKSIFDRKS